MTSLLNDNSPVSIPRVGYAHNISCPQEGLKVRECIKIKPSRYHRKGGWDPAIVLLNTHDGYYLVYLDQDVPQRIQKCVLKGGSLFLEDGTLVEKKRKKVKQ